MTYSELCIKTKLEEWYRQDSNGNIEEAICNRLLEDKTINKEEFLFPTLQNLPKPSLLANSDKASRLFVQSLYNNKRILIVGDYDVDGVASTALVCRFLNYIGYTNYRCFIPNRFFHGYGLSSRCLKDIFQLKPDLVLTVDNGITAYDAIRQLQSKGIEVIVTDHHQPQAEKIPECLIVNPKMKDCLFPFKNLCGAGVTFMFLLCLRKELREKGFWSHKKEPNLSSDLDLVSLGTIADQMNLVELNRTLVKIGMNILRKQFLTLTHSKYSYIHSFRKYHSYKNIDAQFLSFQIIPALNSSGRMETAMNSLNFLMSKSLFEAYYHIKKLMQTNIQRKKIQSNILTSSKTILLEKTKNREGGVFLYGEEFHEGVIGIVANQILSQFHLPAIVLTCAHNGTIRGSGRAAKGFDLLQILKPCRSYLLELGGHKQAIGVSLLQKDIARFEDDFVQLCKSYSEENQRKLLLNVDLEIEKWMISEELFQQLSLFEPYGNGNLKPHFYVRNFETTSPLKISKKTIKWGLNKNIEMICSKEIYSPSKKDKLDIVFHFLNQKDFIGSPSLQAQIIHIN